MLLIQDGALDYWSWSFKPKQSVILIRNFCGAYACFVRPDTTIAFMASADTEGVTGAGGCALHRLISDDQSLPKAPRT